MNKPVSGMIAMLLIFPSGNVLAQSAPSDQADQPKSVSAEMESSSAAKTEDKAMAASATAKPAASEPASSAKPAAAEKTATHQAAAPEKPPEPITGAFGIPLSKPFQPSMVAKVLSEKEHTYTGKEGKKLKGTQYQVVPIKEDPRFQRYAVKTTPEGLIYAIEGDYQVKREPDNIKQYETKAEREAAKQEKNQQKKGKHSNYLQKTCKTEVKALGKELEAKYGKPRGQGWDGLWFAFRQFSDSTNLSLRLYGHRCRNGMYSIVYTDEKLQKGVVPARPATAPKKVKTSAPLKTSGGTVEAEKELTKPAPASEPDSQAAEPNSSPKQ